jgi:hypothetical protein
MLLLDRSSFLGGISSSELKGSNEGNSTIGNSLSEKTPFKISSFGDNNWVIEFSLSIPHSSTGTEFVSPGRGALQEIILRTPLYRNTSSTRILVPREALLRINYSFVGSCNG